MKLNKKDLLVLIVPLLVMILLIPLLPNKIPMQWKFDGSVGWYLDKKFSFVLGLLPFFIYKSYKSKYKKN